MRIIFLRWPVTPISVVCCVRQESESDEINAKTKQTFASAQLQSDQTNALNCSSTFIVLTVLLLFSLLSDTCLALEMVGIIAQDWDYSYSLAQLGQSVVCCFPAQVRSFSANNPLDRLELSLIISSCGRPPAKWHNHVRNQVAFKSSNRSHLIFGAALVADKQVEDDASKLLLASCCSRPYIYLSLDWI